MPRRTLSLPVVILALALIGGCEGCGETPPDDEDGGAGVGPAADAGALVDGGGSARDAGPSGLDAGPVFVDAGPTGPDGGPSPSADAGTPFDWTDLFDGGLPEELACLPGTLPEASISGIISALDLARYTGQSETGVVCGDTTCAADVPCCELCGFAQCAVPGVDGGPAACPPFTRTIACDGHEDCPNRPDADTCCYTLEGTDCRAEADCSFELPDLPSFDGGFPFPFPPADAGAPPIVDDAGPAPAPPDAGPFVDGGAFGPLDAGAFVDAGMSVFDAGPPPPPVDAGPGFDPGAALEELLDQGVPVCRNTLFDCDVLSLEVCCTSERLVSVDLGLCLPAVLCLSGELPSP